jgi:hypothetical protein
MYKLRIIFFLLFNIVFLNFNYSQNEYGVWANENCELFRTKEFALLFERVENRFIAKLFHFKVDENHYECSSYGEIQFIDTIQISKRIDYRCDSLLMAKSIGILISDSLIEISGASSVQKLKLVESVSLTDPYEMTSAEKETVGKCLQEWMLGTRLEMNEEKKVFRFSAGTNNHSYMFDIQENFTYCRSARIKSCNQGTLFAQNIRLYDDGLYKAALMKENNYLEKTTPLEINHELFNPTACVYDVIGFYWSLVRFDKNKIVLNGCSDEYVFHRMVKNSSALKEWIKLENN